MGSISAGERATRGVLQGDPNVAASGPHPGYGTATRVWLVRHAEVDEAWRDIAYGDLDVPLSDEGREDSLRLARAFAARAERPALEVWSSPLSRALWLARHLAQECGAPLAVEEGLRELHRGAWQGRRRDQLPPEEVAAYYADPWAVAAPGAETDERIHARAWPLLERAVGRVAGGELVIVSHYNVIRVLVASALGIAPRNSFSLRLDPGRAILLVDGRAAADGSRTEVPPISGWVLRHSNTVDPGLPLGRREGDIVRGGREG